MHPAYIPVSPPHVIGAVYPYPRKAETLPAQCLQPETEWSHIRAFPQLRSARSLRLLVRDDLRIGCQVNDLVSNVFGEVIRSIQTDAQHTRLPPRPHTACAGVQAIPVVLPVDPLDADTDDESEVFVRSRVKQRVVDSAKRFVQCGPRGDLPAVIVRPVSSECLLLAGMRGFAATARQGMPSKLSHVESGNSAKSSSRPAQLGSLPASMSTKLPRTSILGSGGCGLAPRASRFRSHVSWKDFLPARSSRVPDRSSPRRSTLKTARSSCGYPEAGVGGQCTEVRVADAGVEEDRAIGEIEQHQQTKGPKYRVAPGGSRPVGGPVRQEVKQFVVLEFRSEPRVVPSRRIHAKTRKANQNRGMDTLCSKFGQEWQFFSGSCPKRQGI
ncbi:unnamed protein product [Symbiodinium sp. CCMP2592]|nr:unnamed protein product [Symbiodinium sp. CCMP2592]